MRKVDFYGLQITAGGENKGSLNLVFKYYLQLVLENCHSNRNVFMSN